jgi:hypothetical protein
VNSEIPGKDKATNIKRNILLNNVSSISPEIVRTADGGFLLEEIFH